MALKHAASGDILRLLPATPATALISQALVCDPRLEVMRLALEAGLAHLPFDVWLNLELLPREQARPDQAPPG